MQVRNLILLLLPVSALILLDGCRTGKYTASGAAPEYSSEQTSTADFSEQSTWLLGYFKPERLTLPPYSQWYLKGFDGYRPDQDVLARLAETDTGGVEVTVVMGTWCPDSRREVPRFMKILSMWGFPEEKVTFIGVDNEKKSPLGIYGSLNIEWVPTFIFYKNKVEAGRIIENPVASLEQDMLNILNRNEKH